MTGGPEGTGCGCGCDGRFDGRPPAPAGNPPGQDALARRVGDYGQFLDAMLGRLAGPAHPALHGLTVRTPDDPAVGLLDTWAVLGDLLTFHSERIADEGCLRTARDPESLALLGGLTGYRPRPGVAAGVFLAYSLDHDPRQGPDRPVVIPRGSRSQSVPGAGEEPQSFETVEDLTARWSWNDLRVRQRRPCRLTAAGLAGRGRLHLAGTANNVRPGDHLLYVFSAEQSAGPEQRVLLPVSGVRVDRETGVTVVSLPGGTLVSLEQLREELAAWITDTAGGPHPRPAGSPLIEEFDEQELAPLRAELDLLDTPTGFSRRLDHTVERLDEAQELAAEYPEVLAWFTGLKTRLIELQDRAAVLEPPQPEPDGGGPGPEPPPAADAATAALGSLLPALRTSAPRLPRGARELARDPHSIYAPGSDTGARLLTALDPRLADGLYEAWRRVDVTEPLALREVLAMRVTATPFGATAPLRPVLDGSGRVVRYEDWALTGSRLLTWRVTFEDAGESGPVPARADFLYVEAGGSVRRDRSLPFTGTFDFGPGRVRLTTHEPPAEGEEPSGQEPGVTAELLGDLPGRVLFVSRPEAGGRIRVTVGNGEVFERLLAPGEEHRTEQGDFEVTVRRPAEGEGEGEGDGPVTVEISLSSRLELTSRNVLALDAVHDGIAPGSWVVVQRPGKGTGLIPGDGNLALVVTRVASARVVSQANYGITGKVTELTLESPWLDEEDVLLSHIRGTTVLARGDALSLADEPVEEEVSGNEIELAEMYDGLTPGRWITVTGERADIPRTEGVRGAETAMIAAVRQDVDPSLPGDTVHTTLTLSADLAHRYRREGLRIHGNVVRATHGASRDEAIGSGDAGLAGQTFALWQGPLTWLADDSPRGAASTLEIHVDGVRRHEVEGLAGHGPHDQVFVTGETGDGRTTVTFGDGVHGARLPTGEENVRARYRVGLGKDANVPAERITQPTSRPLGVSGVTNPQPATGGADPDGPGLLRRNIPLAVSALDRLVSVSDYADFARTRAAIGRASAALLSDGRRRVMHVTVAGVDDVPLTEDSDAVRHLHTALTAHGGSRLPVRVAVRELVLLLLVAGVRVDPDHRWEDVEPRLRAVLLERLGPPGRDLGRPARLSRVLAAAHTVPGVDSLEVRAFTGVPASLTPDGLRDLADRLDEPLPVVPALPARFAEDIHRVCGEAETLTSVAARYGLPVAALLRLNPGITGTGPLEKGSTVVTFRGIRPAQLAVFSPEVADTLILTEIR
ncbi:hypothetical protein GCM10009716_31870 [Streptomyces sodiiphilus]|uniref:LysM domain-containing protein n=1 Tax=Streptomyces sodiiphilus TaxID=226217 RepID=A0ABP5AWY5_9ACTN